MMWFFDQYPYVLNYIQFGRLHKIIVCGLTESGEIHE